MIKNRPIKGNQPLLKTIFKPSFPGWASKLSGLALGAILTISSGDVIAQDPVYSFSQQEMLNNRGTHSGNIALQPFRRCRANIVSDVSERGGVFQLKQHRFTADFLDNNTLIYKLYHSTGSDGNGRPVPDNSEENQIGSGDSAAGLSGGEAGINLPNYLVDHSFTANDLIVDFNAYPEYWVVVEKVEGDRGVIVNYANLTGAGSAYNNEPNSDWSGYGGFYAEIDAYEVSPALTNISIDPIQASTATLNVTSHKDATGYYVVVPPSAPAPKPEEIVSGQNYDEVEVLASGSFSMDAGVSASTTITGLTATTSYDVYVVGLSIEEEYLGRRSLAIPFTTGSNTPPSISGEQLLEVCMNDDIPDFSIAINDNETATDELVLNFSSSNTELVPVENIELTGSGENRTLKITPVSDMPGSSDITIDIEDPDGAQAQHQFTFTILELPSLEIVSVPVECGDDIDGSVSVSASGGASPYTYLWSNGATTAEVEELGADVYSVEVTDAKGCKSNAEAEVMVADETAPTIDCSNFTAICEGVYSFGEAITVDDNCSATFTQTSGPEVGEMIEPGQYEVEFTAEDASGNTSVCNTTLNVVAYPEVDLGEDISTPIGSVVTITAGTNPNHTYLWSTGETTNEIVITVEEDVTIGVTVSNELGCEDSDEINIEATINLSTATLPNGNGFKLYPNPTSDVVNLSFDVKAPMENASLVVLDLQGKQLYTEQLNGINNGQVVSLDVSQFQKGMYLATVATKEGNMTLRFAVK